METTSKVYEDKGLKALGLAGIRGVEAGEKLKEIFLKLKTPTERKKPSHRKPYKFHR